MNMIARDGKYDWSNYEFNDYAFINRFAGPWLTHQGRVMHVCIGESCHFFSDNGLAPVRHQTIGATAMICFHRPVIVPSYQFRIPTIHLKIRV